MRRILILITTACFAINCGSPSTPVGPSPSSAPPLAVPPIASKPAAAGASSGAPAVVAPRPKYEAIVAQLQGLLTDPSSASDTKNVFPLKKAFDELRALADPRAADALAGLVGREEPALPPRWKTQAALALAELGDLRALPALAWRLKQDPFKLYDQQREPELRQDDNERVVSARYVADLLAIHPDRREEITKTAEDSVLAWAESKPQPHANAMRALALMGTTRGRKKIRVWADPSEALPKQGTQMFSPAFATAQSALRYVGTAQRVSAKTIAKSESDDAWQLLNKQLFRKPEKADVTMEELMQGGQAVFGMALRALGVGASYGFAEIGDPRGGALLVRFIEDEKQNEQARLEACMSLAWVADDALIATLPAKISSPSALPTPKKELVRACFLETLVRRGNAKASAALLPLLTAQTTTTRLRMNAALAMAMSGVDAALAKSLTPLLDNPDLRNAAGLALILGAEDTATATSTFAQIDKADSVSSKVSSDELKIQLVQGFSFMSDRDHSDGHLARRVQNAKACGGWAWQIAMNTLDGMSFDQGPHSLTRVLLRARLVTEGRGTDAKKRDAARAILEALKQDASIEALAGR